jgi:hypothetical protein
MPRPSRPDAHGSVRYQPTPKTLYNYSVDFVVLYMKRCTYPCESTSTIVSLVFPSRPAGPLGGRIRLSPLPSASPTDEIFKLRSSTGSPSSRRPFPLDQRLYLRDGAMCHNYFVLTLTCTPLAAGMLCMCSAHVPVDMLSDFLPLRDWLPSRSISFIWRPGLGAVFFNLLSSSSRTRSIKQN